MVGVGDDHQFLVVALEVFIGVFAKVTAVGVLTVKQQNGAFEFRRCRSVSAY